MTSKPIGSLLAVGTAVFLALAVWLFPKAQPTIALQQTLTRDGAIARAREFATQRALPISGTRVAVRFEQDGEVQTFMELEAGGKAAVNAEVNRGDVALFQWTVRFFRAGDPREVRVSLAPDGRVIGFRSTLAQADARPARDSVQAYNVADSVRAVWLAPTRGAWQLVASSAETVQPSARVDRTFTWERTDRKLGVAPLRLDVVVRGNEAGEARAYVKVPEPFLRRYAERRADNDLYALIATLFVPVFAVFGIAALVGARKRGLVRWRPATIGGSALGIATMLSMLNDLPGSYFGYETAVPAGTFLTQQIIFAVLAGVGMTLVSTILLAAGELLTREAFPEHFDWWHTARDAGTRPVALRVLAGYTLAAFGLAYVSVFYIGAERLLGWWSPSSLLDDPNQIATPFPWISAVATSLQAGVLEEVLFRAIPLALVARATKDSPQRRPIMAAAVVLSALVFGFGHANYPSVPAYARGVELFAEAILWAVLYLRVGLITTIVGHFTYDLILFALFAGAGDAPAYRITLGVVMLVAAVPALLVLRKALRSRGLTSELPSDARFSAWQPTAMRVTGELPVPSSAPVARAGTWVAIASVAAVAAGLWPTSTVVLPRFTASKSRAIATADSVLRTLGTNPDQWTRLVEASSETWPTEWRYLAQFDSTEQLPARLARVWLHGGTWDVRYVRTSGNVAERTEGWSVQLGADGLPHTWRHVLPDSAPAATANRDEAERLARAALASSGASPNALVLLSAKETARPARRDVEFEFHDTSYAIPGGASARRTAVVAGDRVVRIGHRLFLPEAWERENAARTSTRTVMVLGPALALGIGLVVALVLFLKRMPQVSALPWPTKRRMIAIVAVVGVGVSLLGLNEWPQLMHGWETAMPYNRHLWNSGLGLLSGLLGPVALWGLWLAADATRRRMAVPVRAPSARDAWLVGGALALAPSLPAVLRSLVFPLSLSARETSMGLAIPVLGNVTDALTSALVEVPLLVLVAGAVLALRAPAARVALVVVASMIVGLLGASNAIPELGRWLGHGAVNAVGILLMAALLWRLGRSSMETWLVGGLVGGALSQAAEAMTGVAAADVLAHALGAAVAVGVALVVTSRPRAVGASLT